MSGKKRRPVLLGLTAMLAVVVMSVKNSDTNPKDEMTFADRMTREIVRAFEEVIYNAYFPCISYAGHKVGDTPWILREQIDSLLPFYGYLEAEINTENGQEAPSVREILLEEAREGTSFTGDVSVEEEKESTPVLDQTLAELLKTENEAAIKMREAGNSVFVPHIQQKQIETASLKDYETLLKEFYTVDSNTMIGSDYLNVEKLLGKDMTVSKDSPAPQILIFHTHSQETYADSVPGDKATSIVGVGDHLASVLRENYGYGVLHHTAEYDVEKRDDAYSRALPGVEQVLADNPSIQVIIDLHRDEMPEETRLVMDLDGRPTARFMFFNGLSRTKKTGNIAYLYNENLENNLAFSFQMQKKAYEFYPGLTRKIYLKGYRYNMHLMPKYLLVELGAQNNTVEEAMNACDPLAHILDMVLSGQ